LIKLILFQFEEHAHQADTSTIEKQRLTQEMKVKITANCSQPIKRVYDNIVLRARGENILEFNSVRSQLNRTRANLIL
jgi:hypothetical protein